MLDWIAANTANIIIIAILVAVVTLVIIKLVRDKKAGRSACGGKCSGCAMGGCCGSAGLKNVSELASGMKSSDSPAPCAHKKRV